jgi:hypothetical protein
VCRGPMPCRCGMTYGGADSQCSGRWDHFCCNCYWDGEDECDEFLENACMQCKKRRAQTEFAAAKAKAEAEAKRRQEEASSVQFSQRLQPLLAARSPARLLPPIAHRQEDRLLLFPKAQTAGPNDCPQMAKQKAAAEAKAKAEAEAKGKQERQRREVVSVF